MNFILYEAYTNFIVQHYMEHLDKWIYFLNHPYYKLLTSFSYQTINNYWIFLNVVYLSVL